MKGQHILVVDDEPDIRLLLQEILEDEGYEVSVAQNAAEARSSRRARRPDLVLLDIYLDGCTRWDLLHDIKNRDPDLPVLIFTAYDGLAEDPRLSQADGYVIKSFVALALLKQKVAEILKWKPANPKAHDKKITERAYLLHLGPERS